MEVLITSWSSIPKLLDNNFGGLEFVIADSNKQRVPIFQFLEFSYSIDRSFNEKINKQEKT